MEVNNATLSWCVHRNILINHDMQEEQVLANLMKKYMLNRCTEFRKLASDITKPADLENKIIFCWNMQPGFR